MCFMRPKATAIFPACFSINEYFPRIFLFKCLIGIENDRINLTVDVISPDTCTDMAVY